MKMNAVRFYAPENIKYEQVEVPDITEDEILVKIMAALTCGTDVKTYHRGHPVLIKTTPSGFGHEFAGIIEKIGKNVKNFEVGDRVVAVNTAPCMECYFCKIEEYNLCENLEFLNGAYAEYIIIPKQIAKINTYKIPDHVSFEEAAFVEPLANVAHGIERTEIKPGQTVGIIGLGPIGLMLTRLAKLKGAKVIVAGRNPMKLELAKTFGGADATIDLNLEPDPERAFKNHTVEGRGLDVIIEAVGLPELWERTFKLVRKGGTVHLFGGCKSGTSVNIDTHKLHYDEIRVIGVFHHTPQYVKKSLELIASGQIDVKKLITHKMPLKDLEKAIKMHKNGETLKILISPSEKS